LRKIFINLGANDGIDILTFKKVKGEEFFQWKIFAFEPLSEAIDLFQKNVKFNNVKLIKKAVSTKDEIRNFYLGEGYASISGSLRSDKTTGMIDPLNTIKKNKHINKINYGLFRKSNRSL
jgi:FkbM family methyltransferase